MNTIRKSELPAIGAPLGGGFYNSLFRIGNDTYASIISPKAEGDLEGEYGGYGDKIDASSCNDGLANTDAMASNGSGLAQKIRALRIADLDDWYLWSRDEQEMAHRNFKPTAYKNYCSFRDGDNASSIPAGYPYTEESPAQTTVEAFKEGGAEAFEAAWYWSSTQDSSDCAYVQYFGDGDQSYDRKDSSDRARAVRRLLVIE